MKGYFINERFVASDMQQKFILKKPYLEGGVTVHINGSLADKGLDKDYVEVDNYSIKFNEPLIEGDVVVINSLYHNPKVNVDIISNNNYNPNSLFKKYGPDIKLKQNSKYHICIKIKDEIFNWSFSSKLSPMLTTVDKIRLDTGTLLEEVEDEKIAKMIYLNSKECIDLYNSLNEDSYGSDTGKLPKYLNTWVRVKTNMDMCYAVYLSLSGKSGTVTKRIGVIDIEHSVKLPFLKDMLSRFKDKFEEVDELLKPKKDLNMNFVKAKNNEYPIANRRLF